MFRRFVRTWGSQSAAKMALESIEVLIASGVPAKKAVKQTTVINHLIARALDDRRRAAVKGGKVKTKRKARSARSNGKRGGRP